MLYSKQYYQHYLTRIKAGICETCDLIEGSMAHHKKVHDDRELSCNKCDKIVIGGLNLRNHKKTHKLWSCATCDQLIPLNSKTFH